MYSRMLRRTLACAISLFLSLPAAGEPLRLTASPWAPYVDPGVGANGFAVALVSRALERAGYDTDLTIESWPRALEETIGGNYDVLASVWYREDRAEDLAFSEPYIECEIALIRPASSDFRYAGRDSLVGQNIGAVYDFAYSKEAVDKRGVTIVYSGSIPNNISRLRSGVLDLVLADRRVAMFHINEQALAKSFDVMPDAVLTRGLRIAVPRSRPDHDEIIAAFESAIADMRADGTYNAILATFRISTR